VVYTKRLEKIYSMASITDHRSARHRPIYFTPTQALKGYSTRRKCTQLRLFLKTEKQLQTCGSSRVKILMFFHCYRAKDTVGFLAKLGINSGISVRRKEQHGFKNRGNHRAIFCTLRVIFPCRYKRIITPSSAYQHLITNLPGVN